MRRARSVWLASLAFGLTACELIGGLDTKTLAPASTSTTTSSSGTGGAGGHASCPKEAFPDSTPFCSDGEKEVPCDDPAALPGQDGLHVGLVQSFAFEDPNGEWIRDGSTKLLWRNVPVPFGESACPDVGGDPSFTPPLFYLLSIVDFGFAPRASPYFMTTDVFGTSVSHTNGPTGIDFADGHLIENVPPTSKLRCVRGALGSALVPDDRLLVPNGATPPTEFFDPDTHLTWMSAYAEVSTWTSAVEYCANQPLPADGCGAWRLPSVKELLTVMNLEGYMNEVFFGPGDDAHNPQHRKYWSSTFVAAHPSDVWAVHYGTFGSDSNDTPVAFASVQPTMVARCVR